MCPTARAAAVLALIGAVTSCNPLRSDTQDDDALVRIRYRHVQTCTNFIGNEGQYFVYEFFHVSNRGAEPFAFDPARLRFLGASGPEAISGTTVPDFSELEVAPASEVTTLEGVLLHRMAPGRPPRAPVPLRYEDPDVALMLEAGEPEFDEVSGCVAYST